MIYLASQSPRRRELMKKVTQNFECVSPCAEEIKGKSGFSPKKLALSNARLKALSAYEKYGGTCVGADTIVVLGEKVLGKPSGREEALRMLKELSGKTHKVITAVCVKNRKFEISDSCTSYVTFNELDEEFIEQYVDSGRAYDKAGAYGIQDTDNLVKALRGSRANVIGFPVRMAKRMLKEAGALE
jgi:septum formation protein